MIILIFKKFPINYFLWVFPCLFLLLEQLRSCELEVWELNPQQERDGSVVICATSCNFTSTE